MLRVENLQTTFHQRTSSIHAVRSCSFTLEKSESVGIVGESGSGKTVLAHSLLRLVSQPPAQISGSALFNGIDLIAANMKTLQSIRGNDICMIFQDPAASFNPYYRLADQLVEPMMLHRGASRKEATVAATEALAATGIVDAAQRIRLYPHQFSGGMLQRAMIAMAVMMRPRIIIADEPTTALDVTVQAQLLRLLRMLIGTHGISILFITHNLGIVRGFCDRIIVMYAGMVLETGSAAALFAAPAHPYTRALLQSVPKSTATATTLRSIPGTPPDPSQEIIGCPFAPRCEHVAERCRRESCLPAPVAAGHATACIRCRDGEIFL